MVIALALSAAVEKKEAEKTAEAAPAEKKQDKRGLLELGYGWDSHSSFDAHHPIELDSYDHGHVKQVTITKKVHVPYPVTVEKHVPVYIEKKVPVYIEKHIPVDRPVPYAVKVPVKVPVHIPKPYAVPIHVEKPVYIEKHVPVIVKSHDYHHAPISHSYSEFSSYHH